MIKLDFPTHTVTVQKLPTNDDLAVEIEAKEGADLRHMGPVYVNHALVDRIAELEAQLAEVGDHSQKLATFAAYEAPPLATEADGFICEMALQYGAEMINDDGTAYAFNEEQLLAYTKANRAPNADRIAELEAQLAAVGAGGITAGVPLMGSELAADGDLFRRMIEAMQTDGEAFAERMGALATDEPPTLAEFRQMLREALGDPVEPFDPDLMFAEFSVPAAARSVKLARYLWGLLELSARYGFDIGSTSASTIEVMPVYTGGPGRQSYDELTVRDWWCK